MKRTIIAFALLMLFPIVSIYAQVVIHHPVVMPRTADSIDIAYYAKKDLLRAATMNFGLNMAIWATDRYAMDADFAYISSTSIKKNLKHSFVWDNDQMGTNMFLHPYTGSLYFNSARSNGFNYWESGIFALGGSAMWELFMENEYPSINDIIATPIGGMALGETFYRVSDLILDDRAAGMGRFGRELAAFVVSPTRGLTRIINGDAWKKRATSGKQFGMPPVSVSVSAGIRALELKDEIFDSGTGFATAINMEYGGRYDLYDSKPYDYFVVKANLNVQASQPILGQLNAMGRLIGKELLDTDKRHLNIGLYQHFDYYDSDTISAVSHEVPYKFSTPASFGVGLMYHTKTNKIWDLDAFIHANAILLGGTLSDHYQVFNRNYNLGSGFSIKSGLKLFFLKDKFILSTGYEFYHLYTWEGYAKGTNLAHADEETIDVQGDDSHAIFDVFELKMDIKLWKRLYLTGTYNNYTRHTKYKYYDNVSSKTSEGKLMLTYIF